MPTKRSIDVLRDKSLYRSIAFTRKERYALACKASCPTQSPPSHSSWIA